MAKKTDMSNLKNLGIGIMDTLNGIKNDEENKKEKDSTIMEERTKEEKNDYVEEEKSNTVNNENNKSVKEVKSKKTKKEKSKRSFMLTEATIQKLNLLKLCINNKDLSEIVEESVAMYFEKNKKSIEALVDIYNKVK